MDLTLDQLRVLDAVAKTGSFAAAAAALHRVPSAVSYSVRALEEALGVELFDRSGRVAALTPTGRRLIEEARAVLDRARALEALAEQLRDEWEPELHVVVDGALPLAPITRALRTLSSPDVPTRLRLDVEHQEGVIDAFEADRAHLALHLGFDPGDDQSAFEVVELPDLVFVLVVAPSHPLAALERPTRADTAAHAGLVARDSSPRFRQDLKRPFLTSRQVFYLSDFHSKRLALLDGLGFGWVPRHVVAGDLEAGALRLLPLDGVSEWTYHPRLVSRRGEPLGRAARQFITELTTSRLS